jgi:hypothetical protein
VRVLRLCVRGETQRETYNRQVCGEGGTTQTTGGVTFRLSVLLDVEHARRGSASGSIGLSARCIDARAGGTGLRFIVAARTGERVVAAPSPIALSSPWPLACCA